MRNTGEPMESSMVRSAVQVLGTTVVVVVARVLVVLVLVVLDVLVLGALVVLEGDAVVVLVGEVLVVVVELVVLVVLVVEVRTTGPRHVSSIASTMALPSRGDVTVTVAGWPRTKEKLPRSWRALGSVWFTNRVSVPST